MNWYRDFACGISSVKKTRVTASLVVDIKTGLLQGLQAFSGFDDR